MYFKLTFWCLLFAFSQGKNIEKRSSDDRCITLESQCAFPFAYDGVEYNTCTTADNDGRAWCYTGEQRGDSTKKHWVNCELCDDDAIPTQRCRDSHLSCVFPFEYDGNTYYGCTSDGHDQPWCYTEGKQSWVNCDYCSKDDKPVQRCLSQDVSCHFPFEYQNVVYSDCTDANHDQEWCYTNTDKSHWANCKTCYTAPPIQRCSRPGRECSFPFVYGGVTYYGCSDIDHDQPWCYIDYQHNNDWINCNEECVTEPLVPHCLTKSTTCEFPFLHDGELHNECTNNENNKLWCETNLENHWAFCEACSMDDRYPTQRCRDGFLTCHFPFVYDGVTHNQCTSAGHDQPWCYTNAKQNHWVNCAPCHKPVKRCLDVNEQCHFPFTYNGEEYFGCSMEDSEYPWCYTNADQSKWSYCLKCASDSFPIQG